MVRANPDGSSVRVQRRGAGRAGARGSPNTQGRLDGQPAAVIGIYLAPGANAIASAEAVRDILEEATAAASRRAWTTTIIYDTTEFVDESIHEVIKTLLEAFVLVVIVVFLFLGSLRATIIPLIAVPVALVGTFAVMMAMGFSANTVSLLALVLAIGIVVDDAIVVVEAVEAKMEADHGLTPAEAAAAAMGEITAPIIAITLVLLSVFVPVAFIPGISGELFQQFAVVVTVSMMISAINALTLSPALCARAAQAAAMGPSAFRCGRSCRGIDLVRDGYAGDRQAAGAASPSSASWRWR